MWVGFIRFLEEELAEKIGFSYEKKSKVEGFPLKADFSEVVLTDDQFDVLKMYRDKETDAYWSLKKELNQYDNFSVSDKIYITESGEQSIATIKAISRKNSIENEYCSYADEFVVLYCEGEAGETDVWINLDIFEPCANNYYTVRTLQEVEEEMKKWQEIYNKMTR